MKKPSQQLLVPLLFCLITFAFLGCSDEPSCPDEKLEVRYINDYERIKIPYTGFDTLSFLKSSIGEESYFGAGIRQKFSEKKIRDPNPDCGIYHTEKNEVIEFTYCNIDKSDSLFLQFDNEKGTCTFIGNKCVFYYSIYAVKDLEVKIDSVFIGSKWYYNQTTLINSQLDTLILNKENGILKCTNFNTGKYITINK